MDPLFPHLSPQDVGALKAEASRRLLKMRKFTDPAKAWDFVEEVLVAFRDPSYLDRFFTLYNEMHETRFRGIALSKSVVKSIYFEMKLRRSVLLFFWEEDAKKDPEKIALREAVKNARQLFLYSKPI